jgi:hypothetical protein
MEFVYRAIPHPVRRLFNKNKEGSGLEDSYRLRRMESHASISATKRRRIYLNLTPESVETDFDAPSEPPYYPTNKVTTSVNAMPLAILLYPLTHVSPGQDTVARGPGLDLCVILYRGS